MAQIAALLLVASCAAVSDMLACAWQRAREARRRARGSGIAGLHELVQWFPVLLALDARAPVAAIVAASVAGAVFGSAVGISG